MYKVLIADDEDIICRGLAGMVEKHPGLQVAALAEDGETALEKAMDTLPDLMLVDINMPFLNGLEFIEKIREVLSEVMIIVVTGYDDFEFVQKALRLGVADYVLKPVMESAFFEVLDKAVKRLDSENTSRNYICWLEEWMRQNRSKIMDDFLNSLLQGQMDDSDFEKHMGYLKVRIPVPYEITMIHAYGDLEKDSGKLNSDLDDNGWYTACCQVVQSCLEPYSEILCFQTEEGAVAVISEVFSRKQWEELEEKLREMFAGGLNAKLELVRGQGSHMAELPDIFRKTMEAYKERTHYSELVRQTISVIHTQWDDSELSLQSAADALFVSASYLSRMFRRETGENFAAFLARKRMNEAKFLLKNTNMKMYEIAQKTGYTSQHYFSNAFKKATGVSPADYRRNLMK